MAHMRSGSMLPPGTGGASMRQPSGQHAISQQQSSALAGRIASKKAELDNLKQLRDLSGALSGQMQALEEKIGTLKDGTEAVSLVLANWDNVLRAISMASTKAATLGEPVKKEPEDGDEEREQTEPRLPSTLVRIPAEQDKTE